MNYSEFLLDFSSIILEALPFVVLGVIIAGIFEEFVPQQVISGLFQGNLPEKTQSTTLGGILGPLVNLLQFRFFAIAMGGLLGLVFPMCECGIIAVMRRLVRKGVPLSVCVTYMLAGPIINVVVLMSTFVAFNLPEDMQVLGGPIYVVLIRAGMGFIVACVTGMVVDWQIRRSGKASLVHPTMITKEVPENNSDSPAPPQPFSKRLGNISETALHDFVDITAFLILGATLAAIGGQFLDVEGSQSNLEEFIHDYPSLSILSMMGISVLFCLCSEADAFVAANFAEVWPPAAKMAFLVLGPMIDLKLLVMYTRIFRFKLIWIIVVTVVSQVFLLSMLLHYAREDHWYSKVYQERRPQLFQSNTVR